MYLAGLLLAFLLPLLLWPTRFLLTALLPSTFCIDGLLLTLF